MHTSHKGLQVPGSEQKPCKCFIWKKHSAEMLRGVGSYRTSKLIISCCLLFKDNGRQGGHCDEARPMCNNSGRSLRGRLSPRALRRDVLPASGSTQLGRGGSLFALGSVGDQMCWEGQAGWGGGHSHRISHTCLTTHSTMRQNKTCFKIKFYLKFMFSHLSLL